MAIGECHFWRFWCIFLSFSSGEIEDIFWLELDRAGTLIESLLKAFGQK